MKTREIRTAETGPDKPEEGKERIVEPTGLLEARGDGGRRRKTRKGKSKKATRRRRITRRR